MNAPDLSTHVATSIANTDSNGFAAATALCTSGTVVGGGAEFIGTKYTGDQIIYSVPNGNGWSAAADGASAGRTRRTSSFPTEAGAVPVAAAPTTARASGPR